MGKTSRRRIKYNYKKLESHMNSRVQGNMNGREERSWHQAPLTQHSSLKTAAHWASYLSRPNGLLNPSEAFDTFETGLTGGPRRRDPPNVTTKRHVATCQRCEEHGEATRGNSDLEPPALLSVHEPWAEDLWPPGTRKPTQAPSARQSPMAPYSALKP